MMRTFLAIAFLLTLTACGDREPEFVTRCKRNVELRLSSPNTAKYGSIKAVAPNPNNSTLQALDKHGYLYIEPIGTHVWLAYVDSSNALGATIRNYVFCVDDENGFALNVDSDIGLLRMFIE